MVAGYVYMLKAKSDTQIHSYTVQVSQNLISLTLFTQPVASYVAIEQMSKMQMLAT